MNNFIRDIEKKVYDAGLLPLEKQATLWTEILTEKFDTVLPQIMKTSNMDMWLVICKENCEDPVFKTITTWDMPSARRVTILGFYYDRVKNQVHKMILGSPSPEMLKLYVNVKEREEDVWDCLNRIINQYKPSSIGINKSSEFAYCDGITSTSYDILMQKLDDEYKKNIVSSEELCVKWLQTVTPTELKTMKAMVDITHDIIKASFSRNIITPGKTTTTDIEWYMRNLITKLGFDFWFGPDVDLQRKGSSVTRMFDEVIMEEDLLHCDIGIVCKFIQLHTDVQRIGYVINNEKQVPEGFNRLLHIGNEFQDIVSQCFKLGISGNDVFENSINIAKDRGIKAMLYTHPLGTFGHGAGPSIGMYDKQMPQPGKGEKLIENNTCYALELNIKACLSHWDNQEIYAYLEEDIFFNETVEYISGRQTEVIAI
ncbi:M24 family metallopeptidase [Natronincola ferrireducens]|uniref:Metallopeptidase family M24 n=1 Tax=Natronincola ferrireducens TaxID=393762 RepID=A0A1G9GXA1_9FIRM|nr:M24 family metallopeptidase [Natronincola ferrireducens]SDL05311.1 Metallopeptidase family M24 [Natronincola ferrireducens]